MPSKLFVQTLPYLGFYCFLFESYDKYFNKRFLRELVVAILLSRLNWNVSRHFSTRDLPRTQHIKHLTPRHRCLFQHSNPWNSRTLTWNVTLWQFELATDKFPNNFNSPFVQSHRSRSWLYKYHFNRYKFSRINILLNLLTWK